MEVHSLSGFRERSLTTLDKADEPAVLRLFGAFRAKLGPVGAAKALHALAPTFFPMWDNEIARGYGVSTEGGYFQFMLIAKQQLVGLPADLIPGLSLVKALMNTTTTSSVRRRRTAVVAKVSFMASMNR